MAHVHILVGNGTLQRRLLERVSKELAKNGYSEIRRVEGADWLSLLTENRGAGLFDMFDMSDMHGGKTAIVVEGADKMGQIQPSMAHLIEGKEASAVLLVPCTSESSVAGKEILPLCSVSKSSQPSPWSRERDDLINNAAARHGVPISRDAVMLIKEFFDDIGEAEAETEKLAVIAKMRASSGDKTGKAKIEKGDVETLCLSDDSRVMLRMLDGICSGKTQESIRGIEGLRRNSELLQVLSALHNRLRLALYTASFPGEKAAFSRALGARDYAQRQADNAAKLYGKEKLLSFITGLVRINANEKSGQGASWRDLDILIINLLSDL